MTASAAAETAPGLTASGAATTHRGDVGEGLLEIARQLVIDGRHQLGMPTQRRERPPLPLHEARPIRTTTSHTDYDHDTATGPSTARTPVAESIA